MVKKDPLALCRYYCWLLIELAPGLKNIFEPIVWKLARLLRKRCTEAEVAALAVAYQLRNDDPVIVAQAREIAFCRGLRRSGLEQAKRTEMARYRFRCVRNATLYRYSLHMETALENMLAANSRHACASMLIKWDETQQVVQVFS